MLTFSLFGNVAFSELNCGNVQVVQVTNLKGGAIFQLKGGIFVRFCCKYPCAYRVCVPGQRWRDGSVISPWALAFLPSFWACVMLKVRNYCFCFESIWSFVWGCRLLIGQICPQDVLRSSVQHYCSYSSYVFLGFIRLFFWFLPHPADPTQPGLPRQWTTASTPGPSPARSACRLAKGVHTAPKRWEG